MAALALAERLIPIPASRWVLRTFLGWTAGFVLAIALIVCVDALGVPATEFPLAVSMGLGVGVASAVAWRLMRTSDAAAT